MVQLSKLKITVDLGCQSREMQEIMLEINHVMQRWINLKE